MAPRILLLSADSNLISAFEGETHRIGFELTLSARPVEADGLLGKHNYDAVFIDCDDLHGSKPLLTSARKSPSNRNSAIVAILSGETAPADALDLGATSILNKPLSTTQLRDGIKGSCAAFTTREHRRVRLAVPVYISFGETIDRLASSLNVSPGGIALRCDSAIDADEQIRVKFKLPGSNGTVLARGEVAWIDASGVAGIRFVSLIGDSREILRSWIEASKNKDTQQ